MWEDWKTAWREAVENFRRELSQDDGTGDSRARAMQRELHAAESALEKLDGEIRRTRREAGEERENEQVAKRRGEMAQRIQDEETVRIAFDFARRHGERAVVLERKLEVLIEERTLLARDLEGMKQMYSEHAETFKVGGGVRTESIRDIIEERSKEDRDFSRLEREAKEKAAEERLEELKRKMR